jgi:hypothetical protein
MVLPNHRVQGQLQLCHVHTSPPLIRTQISYLRVVGTYIAGLHTLTRLVFKSAAMPRGDAEYIAHVLKLTAHIASSLSKTVSSG